jgi:hypothetical protein
VRLVLAEVRLEAPPPAEMRVGRDSVHSPLGKRQGRERKVVNKKDLKNVGL